MCGLPPSSHGQGAPSTSLSLHLLPMVTWWLRGAQQGLSRSSSGTHCRTLRLHSSADTSLCSPSGGSVGTPPPPMVRPSPIGSVPVVTSHTAVIPGETVCHGNPSRKPPEWQAAVYLWVQGPCSFTVSIPWPCGHRNRPPQLMRAWGQATNSDRQGEACPKTGNQRAGIGYSRELDPGALQTGPQTSIRLLLHS